MNDYNLPVLIFLDAISVFNQASLGIRSQPFNDMNLFIEIHSLVTKCDPLRDTNVHTGVP